MTNVEDARDRLFEFILSSQFECKDVSNDVEKLHGLYGIIKLRAE